MDPSVSSSLQLLFLIFFLGQKLKQLLYLLSLVEFIAIIKITYLQLLLVNPRYSTNFQCHPKTASMEEGQKTKVVANK